MSKSIMQDDKFCFVCGTTENLHLHHIFYGTGKRKISDKYGCTIYLCPYHHTASNHAIHADNLLDLKIKKMCQARLEAMGWSRELFIQRFGRSYLYD